MLAHIADHPVAIEGAFQNGTKIAASSTARKEQETGAGKMEGVGRKRNFPPPPGGIKTKSSLTQLSLQRTDTVNTKTH